MAEWKTEEREDKAKKFLAATLAEHLRSLQVVATTTDKQREVARYRMRQHPQAAEIYKGMTGPDVLLMHLEEFIQVANYIQEPKSLGRWLEESRGPSTVQRARILLESEPFSVRFLALILFMVEALQSEYGKEIATNFENELREALKKSRINFKPS